MTAHLAALAVAAHALAWPLFTTLAAATVLACTLDHLETRADDRAGRAYVERQRRASGRGRVR